MLKKTPLHGAHIDLGAKTGEFAGYDMPLYYTEGVIKEHEGVRSSAGVFDVSHMGQVIVEGPGVALFWESLTPSSFQAKKNGRAQYTVLTNERGGIIDDLIVTRMTEDKFFAVINAGRKDVDIAWIKKNLPAHLRFIYLEDRALIALQGPKAETVMKDVLKADLSALPYMHMIETHTPAGADIFISRVGYTGEDGFEISVPDHCAVDLWSALLAHPAVKPVGLAARDSLRLEMGYALYGHDIDETTSPVEADIAWVMGKEASGYPGQARIRTDLQNGPARRRVGVKLLEKGVAREGAEMRDESDRKIGILTSGGFSPSLKESIGQGYVEAGMSAPGTKIFVNVRGRNIAAEIQKMPFIPAKTKSMKRPEAA
ncbi:MAG: glycine cleavage system aminomethyltransferase GcvT [Alphaproteobacteria bacterium]|nr:glycine cleavage system aminomethyltransferase GcvT [Alphaproteobacteria bacterium]